MRPQSELREVRPYAGVDDIQDALADLKLEFGDAVVEQAGRTTVSGRAYLRDRVGLRVAHDDEAEIFGSDSPLPLSTQILKPDSAS